MTSVELSVTAAAETGIEEWSVAKALDKGKGNVQRPLVEFDAQGNALAIWEQDVGDIDHGSVNANINAIYANWYSPSTGWGKPQTIVSGLRVVSNPDMYVCDNGNAAVICVVWPQVFVASVVATTYSKDSGWTTPLFLEGSVPQTVQRPQIVIWPDGVALAIWEQAGDIWGNRYVPGIGWDLPTVIGSGASSDLVIAPDGSAMAVWEVPWGISPYAVKARQYVRDAGWGSEVQLYSGAQYAYQVRIAFEDSGTGMATWIENDGSIFSSEMWYNTYDPILGWDIPGRIDPLEKGLWYGTHQLIASENGEFLFLSDRYDPAANTNNIWSNKHVQGIGWGKMQQIEFNTVQDTLLRFPKLDTDSAGHAIVVWARSDGTVCNIWYSVYDGTSWSGQALVEKGKVDCNYPDVALDASGNAICVWMQLANKPYEYYGTYTSTIQITFDSAEYGFGDLIYY